MFTTFFFFFLCKHFVLHHRYLPAMVTLGTSCVSVVVSFDYNQLVSVRVDSLSIQYWQASLNRSIM